MLLLTTVLSGTLSLAADHLDGPAALKDPATDITDVYAWMQDADSINLIMNVHPLADANSRFTTTGEYLFTINSMAAYGGAATESQLICRFASNTSVTCTLNGNILVSAVDPSATAGVTNTGNTFRIFAGLRNDAFFFDLANFNTVRETVRDAASGLDFDEAGCPTLDNGTRSALVNTLTGQPGGLPNATATANFFGSLNTLSIVIQADRTLFGNGPIYAVSAATWIN